MAAVITLDAWRTYGEIARARASGALVRADAVVEKRTVERMRSLGGAGQDRTSDVHVWYDVTVELRVNGELRTLKGAAGKDVGEHARAGLWHGQVIEVEGYYVWRGWHSGLGGDILLALSPLFTGYVNVLAVTARGWRARRRGMSVADPINVAFDMVLCFIAGAVAIPVPALVPGLLGTDQPRYWPLLPAATSITATLLLVRQTLRSGSIDITPAPVGGTTAESKSAPR
ncbi:hypothetical protein [Streptomyces stelliscabiei]|uniref:Uncharacterized protein n=1 Tax=Streptomyces stelliscabiei TaxID=146820 RepID=A0A8I0P1R4_9ACTN|nr:hypothetical protein [Streptomyces stelliscabiei]KND41621.1 hypothetical protein IQ64_28090 [Streptomyces stelliscabiei]MBE1594435.1 hypothetical protein [Streptomyces stelliscabiei]MDX2518903.1 hypothetical protein [Streptomyces stelliscabiei]